jgi:hypothetical protein
MSKKITSLSLLFISVLITSVVFAQPTLQTTNMANAGDVWAYKTITDTTIQPGLTGSGVSWNFSTFFVNPTAFNQTYSVPGSSGDDSYFPTANLKVNSSFGGSEYYYKNGSSLQFLGFKSITSDLIITNTQNILSVPLSYGNSVTNASATGTCFGGFAATGTISAIADGTGTLQLASGTYNNTLRVFYNIDMLVGHDFGLDTYVQVKRYCWYKVGQRAPVFIIESLSISGSLGNSYSKSVLVNYVTPTGVEDVQSNFNFSLSPNPVKDRVIVHLSSDRAANAHYSVMDITGRVWKEEEVVFGQDHSFIVDAINLPKGIYILSVQTAGTKKQQRFIVD